MKNTTLKISIIVSLSLLFSCSQAVNDPVPRGGIIVNIGDDLDDVQPLEYADFIDSSYMIALKTPKSYFQSLLTKAMIVDDKVFTFDELNTKRVNAYTCNGDFLFSFTEIGRSAREFINVTNFSIYENELYATDPIQKRTLVYSTIDGSYIKTIEHPFAALDMNKLSENRYLFLLTNYNSDKSVDYLTHSVIVTDTLFNVIKWGMPHPDASQVASFNRSHWNSSDANQFYSHYTETIYEYNVEENSIDPIYSFDYGRYNLSNDDLKSMDAYADHYQSDRVPRLTTESPVVSGNLIFANVEQSGDKYSIVCADSTVYAKCITEESYRIDMPLTLLGKSENGDIISEALMMDQYADEFKKYGIVIDDQVTNVLLISVLK